MSNKGGIGPDEWFLQARYDLKSAEVMFASRQYIHAVFMCHLAVEKALKGSYASKTADMPPRTHNLVYLAEKAEIELPVDLSEFLTTMDNVSVPTRYPDELKQMRKVYTQGAGEMAKRQIVRVVDYLANEIRRNGISISKIILFGSQAKGGASEGSDIDVAIVSEDFRDKDIFQRTRLIKDAGARTIKKFLVPVDLVFLTPEELNKKSSPVAGYVRAGEILHAA
jgi:HEPN domain-containing protein/acid stress-induced BolA-like protein IbaG/YrbA